MCTCNYSINWYVLYILQYIYVHMYGNVHVYIHVHVNVIIGTLYVLYIYCTCTSLVVSLPRPSLKSLVFGPCQLSCLGSSVGRASVWNTECRGFKSHLRQLSFFIFPLSQVSVCLSVFLSFR